MTVGITSGAGGAVDTDSEYQTLERIIARRVARLEGPLFTTSADEGSLWGHFLHTLDEDVRQHYNCHSCRRFIQAFGGLVTIDERGNATPLLWTADERDGELVPGFFLPAVTAVKRLVDGAKVTGVFHTWLTTWGTPRTPDPKKGRTWTHLHGVAPAAEVYKDRVLTPDQKTAERREEHGMLCRALAEYPKDLAQEALRVLRSGTLTRSEKAEKIAEWFVARHDDNANQLWRAIALAPPGFAHVKTTVISTLLDDLKAGLGFAEVSKRWAEKLHPLQYQRPQAPPKAGTIKQAEELVAKLGVERSLERRFAKLSDVAVKLWEPRPAQAEQPGGGVFGHLKVKGAEAARKPLELPPVRVTWEKFAREVLPSARSLEVLLPGVGSYYGLVTAKHADAPNILQWDNPVSWYIYVNGSRPYEWNLPGAGSWAKATAVFLGPHKWTDPTRNDHQGRLAFFALEGARDVSSHQPGLALFPEILKSEFHGIRAVIEAHSASRTIEGREEGDANGLMFQDGRGVQRTEITVRADGASYTIDRWD